MCQVICVAKVPAESFVSVWENRADTSGAAILQCQKHSAGALRIHSNTFVPYSERNQGNKCLVNEVTNANELKTYEAAARLRLKQIVKRTSFSSSSEMSNKTSHISPLCPSVDLQSVDTAMSILYFSMFPMALLLNGMAAWVSWHLRCTSTFIVYLKNLAAADLLMTLTLPLEAATLLPGASEGLRAFVCRYSGVVFFTSLYGSITLMGLISLDRFFKVVQPFGKVPGQSVMFSVITSTLVWVGLVAGTTLPTIILTNKDPSNASEQFCLSMKGESGRRLHVVVVVSMESLFWLVCTLVVFCYVGITLKVLQSFRNSGSSNSQGKRKTKLRVFLVVFVFLVCFLPLHLIRIPYTVKTIFSSDVCLEMWIAILHKLSLWMSTTNACMDPLLYFYLCREFRHKLLHLMKNGGIRLGQRSSDFSSPAS